MSDIPTPSVPFADRERGSAYLVALLALVVLTIVGLALAFITQTENQLGANERTLQRIFYAADAGIDFSLARALANGDTAGRVVEIPEADGNPLIQPVAVIDTSPFLPILEAPCNLCQVNNAGEYGDPGYRKTTYVVTSTASRRVGGDQIMAQKTVSAMVDVLPQRSAAADYQPVDDPEALAKIRY